MRGNLRQVHRRGIASVPDLLSEGYPDMSKRNQSEPADFSDRPGREIADHHQIPAFSRTLCTGSVSTNGLTRPEMICPAGAGKFMGRHSLFPTGELTREGSLGEVPVTGSRNCFGFQSKEFREKYQGIPGCFFWASEAGGRRIRLSFRRYVVSDNPERRRPRDRSPPDLRSISTK